MWQCNSSQKVQHPTEINVFNTLWVKIGEKLEDLATKTCDCAKD
jgi:hypothetical protein